MPARIVVSSEFTPTTIYFFAKLNDIVNDVELNKCRIAAIEYIEMETATLDNHSCTLYFRSISSSGCIAKNDPLCKLTKRPTGIMALGKVNDYYEHQAKKSMEKYIDKTLSHSAKAEYCQEILQFIKPYSEKRAEKFKQFSHQVIQYIRDGSLPVDEDATSMIDSFNNLEKNERELLSIQINEEFEKDLQPERSYTSFLLNFFENTPLNKPVTDRAKQFLVDEIHAENSSAMKNVSGCVLL